jgi:RNA polymerase sigma-70 factor (ECF subfamily)
MSMPQLLRRSLAGDEAAFRSLVQAHQGEVFRLALSILGDLAEAEEAAQDAFLTAYRALDDFRGEAAFKTWLFSITLNLCRRRLRKRRVRELLGRAMQDLFRMNTPPAHPEEVVVQGETKGRLWQAVEALGEKHRLPVLLYYEHDLPAAEIARVLGLPLGTVLSRLHTARERLRERLSQEIAADLEAGRQETGADESESS